MNQNIGTPQDAHITGIIQDWKIDSNYRNDSQSIPVFFSTNFNISISVTSGAVDYNNKKYTCPSGDGNFSPISDSDRIYYQDDETVTFYLYYPWEDLGGMMLSGIKVNLSNQSNCTDVLRSIQTGSKAAPNVVFTFEHILSKLRLSFSSVVHSAIITNQPSVYFNPSLSVDDENALTKTDKGNITMKNENRNFTVYLAPFKIENNSSLLINAENKNFNISFHDVIPELKRGYFYDYYIDLSKYISKPNPKQRRNIAFKLIRTLLFLRSK